METIIGQLDDELVDFPSQARAQHIQEDSDRHGHIKDMLNALEKSPSDTSVLEKAKWVMPSEELLASFSDIDKVALSHQTVSMEVRSHLMQWR